jgi:plastocyanin
MFHRLLCIFAVAWTAAAHAATVDVAVVDQHGKPEANAVVTLVPAAGQNAGQAASHAPARNVIDQQHETFIPLVVVVRRGGEVVFTNNDTTMHQVYSFSAIKQFQFEIDRATISKPVVFDKPGIAAIGCNIHDSMVAYVFVADQPFAAVSDASGHAALHDVPDGAWHAGVWHPALKVGPPPLPVALQVAGGNAKLTLTAPLSASEMPAMSRMHKSDY